MKLFMATLYLLDLEIKYQKRHESKLEFKCFLIDDKWL